MQKWVTAGKGEADCIHAQEKDIAVDSGIVPVISLGDLEKSQQVDSSWPWFPRSIDVKLKSSLTEGCHEDERIGRVPRER